MRARLSAIASAAALVASGAHAATMSVPLNHSVRLPLAGPAQSVVVGSPSIVDVAVVDSRTVYVSGKSPGDTDVTVIDPLGRVVFRGNLAVAGGASVSVFRGSARTEASCAPYCRDLPKDQAPPVFSAAALPEMISALGAGSATTVTSSQTVSALPAASHVGR